MRSLDEIPLDFAPILIREAMEVDIVSTDNCKLYWIGRAHV